MKKIMIILGILVLAIASGVGVWCFVQSRESEVSDEAKKVAGEGIDIIVFGNLEALDGVPCRYVEELTDSSLETDNPNQHHLIVLYDVNSELNLTEATLSLIRKKCLDDCYDMIYFGTRLSLFEDAQFFSHEEFDDPVGFFYCGYQFHESGNPYTFNGEAWINPDEPDTYYNNPFIGLFYGDNPKKDRADSETVWYWICEFALDGLG